MKTIKCNNHTSMTISMERLDGQNVLMLDFDISEYKLFSNGNWQTNLLPANTIINDKLYLDEKLKNIILEILDKFVETGCLITPNKTNRGFGFFELKDLKENTISIQESSANSYYYIWFGCETDKKIMVNNDNKLVPYKFPQGDILVTDRLHLNMGNAKDLIDTLQKEWTCFLKENLEISLGDSKINDKKVKL